MLLAACGGGGDDAAATATATPPPATGAPIPSADPNAATAANGLGTPAATDTGAATESVIAAPGEQVQTSEATPDQFVAALGRQTIVVVVHQPESMVDDLLLEEIDAAVAKVPNVLVLRYAVADYESYGDLPEKLGIFRAPSVAVVNRTGELQNFWSGFVDRGLLHRVILVANSKPPSKVTAADAAPLGGASALSGTTADVTALDAAADDLSLGLDDVTTFEDAPAGATATATGTATAGSSAYCGAVTTANDNPSLATVEAALAASPASDKAFWQGVVKAYKAPLGTPPSFDLAEMTRVMGSCGVTLPKLDAGLAGS